MVADVIGASPAPAAYLLVAIELLLSHWPTSHTAAMPLWHARNFSDLIVRESSPTT